MMYSINTFSIQKLNNAEFVGFFINLANLIEAAEASKLGFEQQVMTNFAALKNKLSDQVRASSASLMTLEMENTNQKRIKLFKRLIYRLKGVELDDTSSINQRLAPMVKVYLLNPYGLSITRMPMTELTTLIAGFVYDAQSKFTEDDLDDLDITTDLTNLESANQEFIAAYTRRSEERAETTGLTPVLRQQMYELYLSMCYQLQYLANSTLEANATKAAACQPFIGTLNAVLGDAKRRYNQRMNALHNANGEGGNTDNGGAADDGANGGDSGANGGDGGANADDGGGNADDENEGDSEGGSQTPGGGSNPSGSNPSGSNPSGSNPSGDTPSGDNPSGNNPSDTEIDRENGTLHDGTVEY